MIMCINVCEKVVVFFRCCCGSVGVYVDVSVSVEIGGVCVFAIAVFLR